jgi:hypothetical protein
MKPHTITAGPPVVCNPSENRIAYPLRDAHQTKVKHGRDTGEDADDGKRDTEVL